MEATEGKGPPGRVVRFLALRQEELFVGSGGEELPDDIATGRAATVLVEEVRKGRIVCAVVQTEADNLESMKVRARAALERMVKGSDPDDSEVEVWFEEGRHRGATSPEKLADCPYPTGSMSAKWWCRGWASVRGKR